jgi:REP element-mobilizing transposase RayT
MPDSYVIKDQAGMYFLTFQVVAWVDIFTRKRYKDIIVDAFNFCIQHKQLQVHSWCIMSNHVHCIVSSANGELSNTIRDFKRHTSKTIIASIQEEPESRREWIWFQFKKAAQQHVQNQTYQIMDA